MTLSNERSAGPATGTQVPRIVLVDPELLADPFTVYGKAREQSPVVRLLAPGLRPIWGFTRLADCKAMLSDRRFAVTEESEIRPDIPEVARPYLVAMHVDGRAHRRLRTLMAPAFTPARAGSFRARAEAIVDNLLDELAAAASDGIVDLIAHFTGPLPVDVTIDFLGIPETARTRWRVHGQQISSGEGDDYAQAINAVLQDTREAIAHRRSHPGDDPISSLIHEQRRGQLDELELEALIWVTVAASSPVKHFLANAVLALLTDPEQLALLRAAETLPPHSVEELIRWSGLNLISNPRHATVDVEWHGVVIRAGEPAVAIHASANRDPRAFADPDRLDLTRPLKPLGHLGFGYGPHICIGNWLARVLTDVALVRLFRRFPDLALATDQPQLRRVADPGTWRLESLPVSLGSTRR